MEFIKRGFQVLRVLTQNLFEHYSHNWINWKNCSLNNVTFWARLLLKPIGGCFLLLCVLIAFMLVTLNVISGLLPSILIFGPILVIFIKYREFQIRSILII